MRIVYRLLFTVYSLRASSGISLPFTVYGL